MTKNRTHQACWLTLLFAALFSTVIQAQTKKPKAVNDNYSTLKNTPLYFKPALNDTLNGTKLLALAIAKPPTRGTIGFATMDSLIYAPKFDDCDYKDTISYYICNEAFLCDTAKIFIDVLCRSVTIGNAPKANNDQISTRKNTSITFKPTLNDSLNGTTLTTLGLVQIPSRGSVGFKTRDSMIYVPQFNQCAYKDTITYYICNEKSLCDTAKIFVDVTCATTFTNNPLAANDYIVTAKNRAVIFNPVSNDLINGRLVAVGLSAAPINGSISFIAIDTIRYLPKPDFCGTDSLIYRVCNDKYQCDTGFVFFDVRCDSFTIKEVPVIVTFRLRLDAAQTAPVHIVGDFQKDAGFPANWDATSIKMQGPVDGVYSFTDTVFNKIYQFKYLKNNTWQDASTASYAEQARFDLMGCGIVNGSGIANRLLNLSKITTPYTRVLISQDWNNCGKGFVTSFNVILSATPSEGGKATGDGIFFPADSVTVRASVNRGYKFVNWTEGTTAVSTDSIYKFVLGSASRVLVANFSKIPYNVVLKAAPVEGGKITGDGVYFVSDSVTARASINRGYKFVNWTEGTAVVSTDSIYKFVLGTAGRDLVANFSKTTALQDLPSNTFDVFPNPSNGVFTVLLNQDNTFKINSLSVKDVLGREILLHPEGFRDGKGGKMDNSSFNIDLSNHVKGLYFIQLKTQEGQLTKKVLVK